jgi:hypothetical protein
MSDISHTTAHHDSGHLALTPGLLDAPGLLLSLADRSGGTWSVKSWVVSMFHGVNSLVS